MADDEKTQEPTSERLRRAREDGDIAKSPELVGLAGLIAGLVGLYFLLPFIFEKSGLLYIEILKYFDMDFTIANLTGLGIKVILASLMLFVPIFGILFIAGIIGNVAQFGFLFAPKAVLPKLSKINPISGFKNVFSLKKLLEGFMITFKVGVAFGVGIAVVYAVSNNLDAVAMMDLKRQIAFIEDQILILIGAMVFVFFVFAVADFMIKRFQYRKKLMMSKQEVKDEYKRQEGSPEVKSRIRQNMMKMARSRMLSAVPSASVVITNPTHYAVALRYKKEDNLGIPIVVAKGLDHLAIKIKSIARENDIEIIEDPPLARALYKNVDLDKPIPAELFSAVIEVFKQVMEIERKAGKKDKKIDI